LGLPAGKFSYRLPDGDEGLAVQSPSPQVKAVLQRRWRIAQSVASLEPMTRTMAEAVAGFGAEQVGVLSADGQGVPMRKPVAPPPRATHQPQKGLKPGRKKRAGVGYPIDRYRRTLAEVVAALVREPGAAAAEETAPCRPVPEHKRSRVNLTGPEAAIPRGASEAIIAWRADEARSRDPWRPRPWGVTGTGSRRWGRRRSRHWTRHRGGSPGSAPGHPSPRGGGAPVPGPWQRRGAEADGAGGRRPRGRWG
jgi:hypothetical protein